MRPATVAIGACGLLALAVPSVALAAPTGSIAGTVTGSDTHSGLEAVKVCASTFVETGEEEGEFETECATTGANGTYTIEELEPGGYEVEFRAAALPYFDELHEGSVTVGTGPVAGVDAELTVAAEIAGTVTAGGQPVEEGTVCAWRWPARDRGLCRETNENGEYRIKFATPGSFGVEFEALGGFATQYFNQRRHWREVDPVAASLGAVTAAIDGALETGGGVQGTVLASNGAPLQEILVCAVEAPSGEPETCDETGVFGQYSLGPLATGAYKVGFSVEYGREFFGEELLLGEDDGFQTRFYFEQTSLAAANVLALAAPGIVSGIDAHLFPSRPSTAVTPPASTPSPPARRVKRLHCRKGLRKKKVRGKQRCVRVHKHRKRHRGR